VTAQDDDIERRRRALALVRAALDQPDEARAGWIAAGAGGDDALAREALALLELDRVADASFDGGGREEVADPVPGTVVGRYRVERRIGSGGMGAVYRAVPVEGPTRQPVALKLVKRGMDSEDVLARFLREREILARLDHPHIARLLDGGLSADGRPWFAMELVDGEPLPEWCDAQRLDLAARVALFADVCDAVAFAHRNLVVHRDLKPANVFVARAGGVKLLDFGIAKLLDGDAAEATRATRPLMTPEYAAPEQFDRGAITTQTDVFQLGVMLHELLGGLRAPVGKGRGDSQRLDLRLRALAPADPERLQAIAQARSTTPAGLQRAVRGDLDRIVRRAMHPDPAQRYASPADLAEDLRRWRRGEPVSATGDALGYRLRMALRRHRLAVAAAAAVVAALAAGLGLATREAARARQAERATENALALLETVFLGADPYQGKGSETRASDLLARAKDRILGGDLRGEPAIAARLLAELGETYVSLGDRTSAEATLREALRIGEPLGAAARVPTETARARLAHYRLVVDGDATALPGLELAIARLRAGGPEARIALAEALDFEVDHRFNIGDHAAVATLSAEALAAHRAASGAASTDHATALGNHASLMRAIGREADALAAAAEGWRIVRERGDDAPAGAVAYVAQQYAGALAANGRAAEAEPLLREAFARARAAMGEGHPQFEALTWELAELQVTVGRFEDALAGLRALQARARMKSANIAAIENQLARVELELGHADAALESSTRARDLLCAGGTATPPCLVVRLNRVEIGLALGRFGEAATELAALEHEIPADAARARARWRLLEASRLRLGGDADAAAALLAGDLGAARGVGVQAGLAEAAVLAEGAAIAAARGDAAGERADLQAAEGAYARTWSVEPPRLARIRQRIAALDAATRLSAAPR